MTAVTRTTGKDDVRAGILNASLQLMNEGGLGALSMREVARRAGVSHQAPYHYFQDREAILAELAGEGFDQLYDYMVSAVGLVRDRGVERDAVAAHDAAAARHGTRCCRAEGAHRMSGLAITIPVAMLMGLAALGIFLWALRSGQYEDMDGASQRILDEDDTP